jgi:hypothetical protein
MTEGKKTKNATPDNISQEKVRGHIYLMNAQLITFTLQTYHSFISCCTIYEKEETC